jgi:hypothetical protein
MQFDVDGGALTIISSGLSNAPGATASRNSNVRYYVATATTGIGTLAPGDLTMAAFRDTPMPSPDSATSGRGWPERLRRLNGTIAKQREALAALDTTPRLSHPDADTAHVTSIQPIGRSYFFRRGERVRPCLEAL